MLFRNQAIKRWFIFPPHLNSISALPCKTDKYKNCTFSLNAIWLWSQCRKWALLHGLFFLVECRVKVNSKYYWHVLLWQQMLPAIRHVGDNFVFQQDSTPAHPTRDTIELLQRETSDFIFSRAIAPTVQTRTTLIIRLGSHAAACVWDAEPQCRRTRAATGWCLERSAAKCCRLYCQRVEKASVGVCSRERRTLRTSAAGWFDNGTELSIDSLCRMSIWIF